MSQRFSLYGDLSIDENIEFFADIHGVRNYKERRNELLEFTRLTPFRDRLADQLSGGMKQKLALACSLIHKPKILFLDEPTSGVDPIARRNFWELINSLSEDGTTVVVTTHYLEEAEYCNNIILIVAGKLIAEGNPKELKERYIKNKIVEIECERISNAIDILSKEGFIIETNIFGNSIHICVNEDYHNEKQIVDVLSSNFINVYKISEVNPTLEDVFIHLLDKK